MNSHPHSRNQPDIASQLRQLVHAIWQHRWYAVTAAWIVALAGWGLVAMLPDRYLASARVYVDTQSILRPLLAGLTMQPNVQQVVEMMSRTLISRPNVERVMVMNDIKPPRDTPAAREETITRLSRDLTIRDTGSQNLYTISYGDSDPARAQRVVQSLVSIFEDSLGAKQKDSVSARNFIEDQMKQYGDRLAAAENAMTEFKRRNVGLMPGQSENFYPKLNELRDALNQAKLELSEAEQSRLALRRGFTDEAAPSLIDERAISEAPAPEVTGANDLDTRIQALQQKLDALRVQYTDRHPDIATILPALEELKAQREREREQKQREVKARKPIPAPTAKTQNFVAQQLTISMAEIDANIAALRTRVQQHERSLAELRSQANMMPQVETQYAQLAREYELAKKNYDLLSTRRDAAQLSGDVQSNAAAMEFRVIDPPQVGTRPEWPNRSLYVTAVLLLALAAGLGCAFLVSVLHPTINGERALREVTGLPVLGTVGMNVGSGERRRRGQALGFLTAAVFALLFVYAAQVASPYLQRMPAFAGLLHR